jgi:hypothetical protein
VGSILEETYIDSIDIQKSYQVQRFVMRKQWKSKIGAGKS